MQESQNARSWASRPILKRTTITHLQVIAALGSGSGAVAMSLGTPPPGAFLMQETNRVATNFAGGSLSSVTGQIGPAADPDQIASGIALHTGTAGGAHRPGTAGINPQGTGYGGVELFLTFTPAGAELSALTGGSITVDQVWMVPDPKPGY